MAFSTITSKYAGTCKRCTKAGLDGSFPAGTKVRWARGAGSYHLSNECPAKLGGDVVAAAAPRRGRCEDAPCCGHSDCGFGPGVPGYGSNVGGVPYFGEADEDYFEQVALRG